MTALIVTITLCFSFSVFVVLRALFYFKYYTTKTQTSNHDIGWHLCYNCKKCEDPIYASNSFVGVTYKCSYCSRKKN